MKKAVLLYLLVLLIISSIGTTVSGKDDSMVYVSNQDRECQTITANTHKRFNCPRNFYRCGVNYCGNYSDRYFCDTFSNL